MTVGVLALAIVSEAYRMMMTCLLKFVPWDGVAGQSGGPKTAPGPRHTYHRLVAQSGSFRSNAALR